MLTRDDEGLQSDDEVGEARPPSCFPSAGASAFELHYSDPNHGYNGYARLDYRFGQRSSICPPPAFSVSISGPTSAPEYSSVTMTATPANYSGAVNYAWEIDGVPACGNQNTCTGTLGAAGTFTSFVVTATDGAGAVAGDARNVFAEYPGCPDCLAPGRVRATDISRAEGPLPVQRGVARSLQGRTR